RAPSEKSQHFRVSGACALHPLRAQWGSFRAICVASVSPRAPRPTAKTRLCRQPGIHPMLKLPRAHLLDPKQIDEAVKSGRRCVLNDGGEVAGGALEIHIRSGNGRAVFRYPGAKFGEPRIARHPLGPYHSLPLLWAERAACEKLIREGKSPKRHHG